MRHNQTELFTALKQAKIVVDAKASMPILAFVLLSARKLFATDLLHSYLTVDLSGEGKEEIALPLKSLSILVEPEKKQSGSVEIIESGDKATVTTSDVTGMITRLPAEDFPSAPSNITKTWSSMARTADLLDSLQMVLPAVSDDAGRGHLNQIMLRDGLATGTDGHRVIQVESGLSKDLEIGLPYGPACQLEKILKTEKSKVISLSLGTVPGTRGSGKDEHSVEIPYLTVENIAEAGSLPWSLVIKGVLQEDHRFPPTHKVIPRADAATAVVEIDAAKLTAALKRLAKLKINSAFLRLGVDLSITVVDGDESVTINVPAKIAGQIEADQTHFAGSDVGICLRYFQESIQDSGTVTMRFRGPTDGIRVESKSGLLCVVMPVRL